VTIEPRSWLQRGPFRAVSLLLATPLALLLLIHPAAMLDDKAHYSHGLLSLVMWGISCGFIHGVGFTPYSRLWRGVFHPLAGWLMMGLGYAILWRAQH